MAGIDPTIYLLDKNQLITMALENIVAGTVSNNICLLPAQTFVKVTRVVNYVVSQTDVAAMDEGKCPDPPSKAPDPEAKAKAELKLRAINNG